MTFEQVRPQVEPWLQPITPQQPAGGPSRLDPRYEQLTREVGKLEAPAGEPVQWSVVIDAGTAILATSSKDLVVASYVAHALYVQRGLDGLALGLVLLIELIERFWDSLFPEIKRLRGRVNALSWYVDRTSAALGTRPPGEAAATAAPLALEAARRLDELVREKLAADAPSVGPMIAALERLAQAAETATATATGEPTSAAAPPVPSAFAAAPASADPEAMATFLRQAGTALIEAGTTLRHADSADPSAYRVHRVGLWLHLTRAPGSSNGRTAVPAPPAPARAQLDRLAANERWLELLDESESALGQHRLALDLQRFSFQALRGLGASHASARDALVAELRAFLGRLPGLPDLRFADGTPVAEPQTRAWLDEDVLRPVASAPAAHAPDADDDQSLGEARKLALAGDLPGALGLLQGRIQGAASARARFRARLELARLCAQGGEPAVGRSLYQILDREMVARGLEEWEPALAAQCLAGYLDCVRLLARAGKELPVDAAALYSRLCGLDPAGALRLGS